MFVFCCGVLRMSHSACQARLGHDDARNGAFDLNQYLNCLLPRLQLPRNGTGSRCLSSIRTDGMGRQILEQINNRIVASALGLPFCAWRLLEPDARTMRVHPRAGRSEWTNGLNICDLRVLPVNKVLDGDCKHHQGCSGCSICNCPVLDANGLQLQGRGRGHRVQKNQWMQAEQDLRLHVTGDAALSSQHAKSFHPWPQWACL